MSNILQNDVLDIFSIMERKLEASFPKNLFQIEGYNIIRNDFTQKSKRIMFIIRDDIPPIKRLEKNFQQTVFNPLYWNV